MKIAFPINLKRTDFLEATPSLRSTWTFKLSSISILVNMSLSAITLLYFWKRLPPLLPLWYSKPWGNERLVSPLYLLLPIMASIAIYALNIFVANKFATEHPMFARVLFLTSALVSIISMIIVIRVVTLVT
jgi:hypothetical protein